MKTPEKRKPQPQQGGVSEKEGAWGSRRMGTEKRGGNESAGGGIHTWERNQHQCACPDWMRRQNACILMDYHDI
jgi:hypothetical protein